VLRCKEKPWDCPETGTGMDSCGPAILKLFVMVMSFMITKLVHFLEPIYLPGINGIKIYFCNKKGIIATKKAYMK
jgi:hypothetical protein